jgi:hypothetical protein
MNDSPALRPAIERTPVNFISSRSLIRTDTAWAEALISRLNCHEKNQSKPTGKGQSASESRQTTSSVSQTDDVPAKYKADDCLKPPDYCFIPASALIPVFILSDSGFVFRRTTWDSFSGFRF